MGICTTMSYNGMYDGLVVSDDLVPVQNLGTKRKLTFQGTARNVFVQWPNVRELGSSLEVLYFGSQFFPDQHQSFVFEAHERLSNNFVHDLFPEAIAHALAMCRVSGYVGTSLVGWDSCTETSTESVAFALL